MQIPFKSVELADFLSQRPLNLSDLLGERLMLHRLEIGFSFTAYTKWLNNRLLLLGLGQFQACI